MLSAMSRPLFAIGVSLLAVVIVGGQTGPSGPLSAELQTRVRDERFGIITSIRGMPLGVRGALQTLFGSDSLDIAEPGARFQENERSVSSLPTRRLTVAGCSYEYCLVYYVRGGAKPTWHVALFHWAPDETKFLWGGLAPGGLLTIEDVRKAVLSGTIKGSAGPW
jgi:hypothetical protein